MYKEYKLVTADTAGQLSLAINDMLNQGWELWGNPVIYHNCGRGLLDKCYGQAVVRYEAGEVIPEHLEKFTELSIGGYAVGTPG